MKKYIVNIVLIVLIIRMATGCATIIHGSSQDIIITSSPSNAEVIVNGSSVGNTPAKVNLKRDDIHLIKVKKDGYTDSEIKVQKDVSAWILGNIIFGGIIGCGIDFISGAAYELKPNGITVNLNQNKNGSNSNDTSKSSEVNSTGSGFLLNYSGLVVTNYHVIKDARRIEIVFPDKKIVKEAAIKIKDVFNDIVVLEVKDFMYNALYVDSIPYVFAEDNSTKIGQEIYTLGYPFGDILGTKSRLSTGRVNSLYGFQDDPRTFQISNPLQPGNSGGPLFNSKGELIGIVVSSLNDKYFYENAGVVPQNVNFAIKSIYLKNLISMLPESNEIFSRKTKITQTIMDVQINQINSFILQIRTY